MRAHETRLRQAVAELVQARRAGAAAGEDLLARMPRARDAKPGKACRTSFSSIILCRF